MERAGKSSQRQQEPLQLCVRQEVDMRIKLLALFTASYPETLMQRRICTTQALLLVG